MTACTSSFAGVTRRIGGDAAVKRHDDRPRLIRGNCRYRSESCVCFPVQTDLLATGRVIGGKRARTGPQANSRNFGRCGALVRRQAARLLPTVAVPPRRTHRRSGHRRALRNALQRRATALRTVDDERIGSQVDGKPRNIPMRYGHFATSCDETSVVFRHAVTLRVPRSGFESTAMGDCAGPAIAAFSNARAGVPASA
jgi:hypothetical protein